MALDLPILPVANPRLVITGTGTRGPFDIVDGGTAIRVRDQASLVVMRYASVTDEDGEELVLDTDYTVDNTDPDDASLTLTSEQDVLASTERLVVERTSDIGGVLDIIEAGDFSGPNLAAAISMAMEQLQELRRDVDLSPRLDWRQSQVRRFPLPPTSGSQFIARNSSGDFVYATAADLSVDVVLGTRQAAALAAPFPFLYYDAYGAVGDGVTDDTVALQATHAAIAAIGCGTAMGRSGAIYCFSLANSAALLDATGLRYFGLELHGAKLKNTRSYTAGQSTNGFIFRNCDMLYMPDINFEDLGHAYGASGVDRGHSWVGISNTCKWSHFSGSIRGGINGVYHVRGVSDAETNRSAGSHFVNLISDTVYYPLSAQLSGDGIHGMLRTKKAGRSFIAYGFNNCNLDIISQDAYSGDLLLSSVNQAAVTGGAANYGWNIRYTRLPNSGTVSPGADAGAVRFWGHNGAQTIDDINLDILVLEPTVANTFLMLTTLDNGSNDPAPPAHRITGQIRVQQPVAPAAEVVRMFDDPLWAAVDAEGLDYSIVVGGNAAATVVVGNYAFGALGDERIIAPVVTREGTRPYSNFGAYSRTAITPVWGLSGGSGFAFGSAVTSGYIARVTEWDENNEADFIIQAQVVWAGNSNLGTAGAVYFTLPSPFNALTFVKNQQTAQAFLDLSTVLDARVRMLTSAQGKFFIQYGAGYSNLDDTTPEAWDAGDGIYVPQFRVRLAR